MKRQLIAFVALAGMVAPASAAMTDDQCQSAWTAADVNKDGTLDATESSRYVAALRVANRSPASDEMLTRQAFVDDCKAGYFETASAESGAPFAGANSFTEAQARDRLIAAGLANVSALTKDDKGIWRGTAESEGKKVNVAVDYKGNVVTDNM